ncbi:MAG: ATP-binding protein [Candidatus Woesearchaeota archaeon]
MKEANSPVDIGAEQIKNYKKDIENILVNFPYGTTRQNVPGLIRSIDEAEPEIMSNLETNTYLTLREGMQIFKAVGNYVSDKVGLKQKIIDVDVSKLGTDPELLRLQDFSYSFAAFVASTYISKKVSSLIDSEASDLDTTKDVPDLSYLQLNASTTDTRVITQLLTPVAAGLINHSKDNKREFFKTHMEFPAFVRDIYSKYAELTKTNKDKYLDLQQHIDGYTFRIMDDFVTLNGYEDKSIAKVSIKDKSVKTFAPIDPNSIVGNDLGKGKIYRYAQRLILYDAVKQLNPIMDLGGLTWSAVMDGPPGTGKTSMLRMFMTLLDQYSSQLGLDYSIIMIDQSIKDEFYGKTGKILYEKLSPTRDPTKISGVLFEDIDLLTSKRNDAQGADNDINNIIMQYLDGAFTVRRGNIINFASTNRATGLDDAMRNRFNDRIYVDGPVDSHDFADITHAEIKKLMKQGLAKIELGTNYVPLATQKIFTQATEAQVKETLKNRISSVAEEFERKYKNATIIEFGQFMSDAKKNNNGITGRSAKAITEAIKERSADFDIPSEWLTDRTRFIEQPWDTKINMLKELYTPITAPMLFEEAQRYIDSEARYAQKDAQESIERGYNNAVWNMQSEKKLLEEQIASGMSSDFAKLAELRAALSKISEAATLRVNKQFENAANK